MHFAARPFCVHARAEIARFRAGPDGPGDPLLSFRQFTLCPHHAVLIPIHRHNNIVIDLCKSIAQSVLFFCKISIPFSRKEIEPKAVFPGKDFQFKKA